MHTRDKTLVHLILLLALCALQLVFLLGHGALWDIDEGMHAVIAQNMLVTGDWVTPVFNGEPFFDKPALFNWLVAASFWSMGFTEFAARAPAALAGIGCVLLTYQIGRQAYGATAGFIAAVALTTSLEFAIVSRVVQYDVPFVFLRPWRSASFARHCCLRTATGDAFFGSMLRAVWPSWPRDRLACCCHHPSSACISLPNVGGR